MPILSTFFGIIVRMWHDDHPPPHIHVEYQGFEALVNIQTGCVSQGKLPVKAAAIVRDWCVTHREELMQNWARAQRFEPLQQIRGADYDD
jgi:hypothetical protein